MSYILEALKRAEAERERGKVPGITTHPSTVGPSEDEDEARAPRASAGPIAWGAGLALVAVGGAVAWHLMADRRDGPAPLAPQIAQAPAPAPVTTAPLNALPATPAPPPLAPAPSVTVAPPPGATVPAAAPPQPSPSPVLAAPPQKGGAVPPAAVAATAPASMPAPHPAAATAAAEDNLPPLPIEIRRELALSVGGSIYSDDPHSRFLILNGQVLHEGDSLQPGVVLEKIRLKSAVLSVRGARYSLGY